jgi:hypothetical protein
MLASCLTKQRKCNAGGNEFLLYRKSPIFYQLFTEFFFFAVRLALSRGDQILQATLDITGPCILTNIVAFILRYEPVMGKDDFGFIAFF